MAYGSEKSSSSVSESESVLSSFSDSYPGSSSDSFASGFSDSYPGSSSDSFSSSFSDSYPGSFSESSPSGMSSASSSDGCLFHIEDIQTFSDPPQVGNRGQFVVVNDGDHDITVTGYIGIGDITSPATPLVVPALDSRFIYIGGGDDMEASSFYITTENCGNSDIYMWPAPL